ncbi:uncharacterized protein F54H12.2-like [Leptodactylus fuscus]|uniref:uncharacterized protein F54H12.2-like n=1 Tax=Leptodactylus fuscus TaxID=238119 RepID=UPI003F4E6AD6
MAFIHDGSLECTKSELDIFDLPPTQTSIEKSLFVEVQTIAAFADNAPLEFFISGSGEYYYDLNNTLLYITCRIVKSDNTAIPADANVGLVNYPIATLFSQTDVMLGDRLISRSDNFYTYRTYIKTILNYSPQSLSLQFTSGLFYKDTAGHHHERTLAGNNLGFAKRARYTSRSRPVQLLGSIFGNIFNQPKLILNGLDLKIRACLKVYSIPAGTHLTNQENLFLGQVPKTVIIRFVENEAFIGSYNRNPLCFHHYNVNQASLYLDGQQIPARPFQPDFETASAVREYAALLHISGKQRSDSGSAIDRDEFINGYTCFAFDLSPDQGPGGHFSLIKTGNLRAEVHFAVPTPHTVNMIVYSIHTNIVEINNRREIVCDF